MERIYLQLGSIYKSKSWANQFSDIEKTMEVFGLSPFWKIGDILAINQSNRIGPVLRDWKPLRMPVQLPVLPASAGTTLFLSFNRCNAPSLVIFMVSIDWNLSIYVWKQAGSVRSECFQKKSWSWLLNAWIPVYFFYFLIIVLSYLPC